MRFRIASIAGLSLAWSAAAAQNAPAWRALEPGLDLARPAAAKGEAPGDGLVTILRADPARFRMVLHMARFEGERGRTAKAWAREKGMLAATNAGLYQADHSTNVGQMVDGRRVNNPKLNEYGMVLAFNPVSPRDPAVAIVDRRCGGDAPLARYATRIQNLRFLDCRGRPVWRGRVQPWSIAVFALDTRGRMLFVYTQTPHTAPAFAELLLSLRIDARTAIYLEGGSPSQFFLDAGGTTLDLGPLCGSAGCAREPLEPRAIPNVIGIVRR